LLRGVLDPADAALAVPSGFAVSTNDTGPVAFIPKARVVREDVPLAGSYVPPSAVGRLVGDDICAICLEPLRTQAQTIALCGHVFHRSCLNASRSSVCPQCRQPIDVEEAAFGSMHGNISLGGSLPSQISRPRREHRQHGNGHSHSGQQHSNNPSSWRSAGRTAGRTAAQEESFTAAVDSSLARVNSAALGGSRNGHQRARTGSPSIARGDGRRPLSLAAFADGLAMLSATLSSERSRATQLSSLISALARHSEGATSSLEGRTGTSGSGAFGTASGLLTGIDSTDIGHSARHYSGHSEHGITGVDAPFGENAARAGGHLESQSSMNVASYAAHSPRLSRRATRNSRSADPIRSLDMAGLGDLSELGSLLGAAASLRDLANVSELQQGLGARHNPLESRSTQEVQPDGHVSLGAVPMVPHYIGSYGSSGSYVLPVAASASPDASLSRAVARFAFFADGPVPGVGPITSPGLAHAETQGPRSVCNQPRPRSFGPGLQQHPQQVVPQLTIPHLPLGSIPTAHADGRADDGMGLGTGGEPSSAHPCLTDVPDTLPSCLAARLELQVNRDGSARLLGQGAYAIVCRVSERATGLTRALKVMARQPLAIRGLEDQAHREMTLQQDLRHPHILRIYDAVEANGHFYMLSEYAAFGSLQQLAGRAPWRRLYQPTAAFFLQQVTMAVSYLHSDGVRILHRDLKADNVLLFSPELCKLADFGWSVDFSDRSIPVGPAGTASHMAPEVLEGHPHGTGADCWSLGVLLYEVIVGNLPFADAACVCWVEYEAPSFMSPASRGLLARLLRRDPAQRLRAGEALFHPFLADAPRESPLTQEDLPLQRVASLEPGSPRSPIRACPAAARQQSPSAHFLTSPQILHPSFAQTMSQSPHVAQAQIAQGSPGEQRGQRWGPHLVVHQHHRPRLHSSPQAVHHASAGALSTVTGATGAASAGAAAGVSNGAPTWGWAATPPIGGATGVGIPFTMPPASPSASPSASPALGTGTSPNTLGGISQLPLAPLVQQQAPPWSNLVTPRSKYFSIGPSPKAKAIPPLSLRRASSMGGLPGGGSLSTGIGISGGASLRAGSGGGGPTSPSGRGATSAATMRAPALSVAPAIPTSPTSPSACQPRLVSYIPFVLPAAVPRAPPPTWGVSRGSAGSSSSAGGALGTTFGSWAPVPLHTSGAIGGSNSAKISGHVSSAPSASGPAPPQLAPPYRRVGGGGLAGISQNVSQQQQPSGPPQTPRQGLRSVPTTSQLPCAQPAGVPRLARFASARVIQGPQPAMVGSSHANVHAHPQLAQTQGTPQKGQPQQALTGAAGVYGRAGLAAYAAAYAAASSGTRAPTVPPGHMGRPPGSSVNGQ